MTETIWPTKPKFIVFWLCAENVCQSLVYSTGSFVFLVPVGFGHCGAWQEIEGKEERGVGDLIPLVASCGCLVGPASGLRVSGPLRTSL